MPANNAPWRTGSGYWRQQQRAGSPWWESSATWSRWTKEQKREGEVQQKLDQMRFGGGRLQPPEQPAQAAGAWAPPTAPSPSGKATDPGRQPLTDEQLSRADRMRKVAVMIKAATQLKEADEDAELPWLDDMLAELRGRAKGCDPPTCACRTPCATWRRNSASRNAPRSTLRRRR